MREIFAFAEKACCQIDVLRFCHTYSLFWSRTHVLVFVGDSTKTMPICYSYEQDFHIAMLDLLACEDFQPSWCALATSSLTFDLKM